MDVFVFEGYVMLAVYFVLLVIKFTALTSALLWSAPSYVAADKLNKPTWCILLGIALALQLLQLVAPIQLALVNLAMTIAAIVYLVDVRPALAGLRRR